MKKLKSQDILGIRNDQLLLLKAALFDPEEAISNWKKWKIHWHLDNILPESSNNIIFNQVDAESKRLLPLVYRNIEHSGDELLPALRDIYRKTWMRNQQLLKKAQNIIKLCDEAGIPTMILKGLPMSIHYYNDMGVRPMGDVDLLVPIEYVDTTVALLSNLGHIPESVESKYRQYIHAMHCYDPKGWDVDLHWHIFFFQDTESATLQHEPINRQMISLSADVRTEILNDSLQLFHAMIHGVLDGKGTLRWVADAAGILRTKGNSVDFAYLAGLAKKTNTTIAYQHGLSFLTELLGLKVEDYNDTKWLIYQGAYFRLTQWMPSSFVWKSVRMILRSGLHCILFRTDDSIMNQIKWIAGMIKLRMAQEK